MKTNCFKVIGDRIFPGIPYYRDGKEFYVGYQTYPPMLLERRLPVKLPPTQIDNGSFFNADAGMDQKLGKFLSSPGDSLVVSLIYWDTTLLNFNEDPIPGTSVWPGGEFHEMEPFWRVGTDPVATDHVRKQRAKQELWILKPGEKCLIADQSGAVRLLEAGFDDPSLFKPKPEEVAKYLYARALKYSNHLKTSALFWAVKNLAALQNIFTRSDDIRRYASEARALAR